MSLEQTGARGAEPPPPLLLRSADWREARSRLGARKGCLQKCACGWANSGIQPSTWLTETRVIRRRSACPHAVLWGAMQPMQPIAARDRLGQLGALGRGCCWLGFERCFCLPLGRCHHFIRRPGSRPCHSGRLVTSFVSRLSSMVVSYINSVLRPVPTGIPPSHTTRYHVS